MLARTAVAGAGSGRGGQARRQLDEQLIHELPQYEPNITLPLLL